MINTSRLLIRQFQEQDHISLFEYLSNPGIYRFEPGEPISPEEAKELTFERAQSTDFWAVILKSTRKMVGHLYFKQTEPREFSTWELVLQRDFIVLRDFGWYYETLRLRRFEL